MLIVCNGPRRSGSTLQYNLTREIAQNCGKTITTRFVRPDEDEPDWASLANGASLHVVKMHHVSPNLLAIGCGDDANCHVVATHRDLRDVASSLLRFSQLTWEETIAVLDEIVVDTSFLCERGVLFQPYDSLYNSPLAAAQRLSTHLGFALDDWCIAASVSAVSPSTVASTSSLSQRAKAKVRLKRSWSLYAPRFLRDYVRSTGLSRQLGFADIGLDAVTQVHVGHISNSLGRPGLGRLNLLPEQIAEIEDRYPKWLQARGYEANSLLAEVNPTSNPRSLPKP